MPYNTEVKGGETLAILQNLQFLKILKNEKSENLKKSKK